MQSRAVKSILSSLSVMVLLLLLLPTILQASGEKQVLVEKFVFKGNTVVSSEELSKVVKGYEGRELTFSELRKVSDLIIEEYKRRAFIIAKAYIPEQRIERGAVEIAILEGKIGEIIIEGDHKYYSDGFIQKHFANVQKSQALNQDDLERALLVLNEYPKLNVKATLQAGKEAGTTDIVVKAENSMPVYLTLDYNNFGSRYVSRHRLGATFDVGNLLKEGAVLSLRGVTGEEPNELFYYRGQYTIPLSTMGTKLGVYYAKGDSEVGREFAVLDLKGESEAYGIFVSHPFIKKRTQNLTAEMGLDFKDATQHLLGVVWSEDKIRSLRVGATYESTDTAGRTSASLFVVQGLGEMLGGMDKNDQMASRSGADNRFTKFNLDLMRLQKIASPVYLILRGSGQLSSESLVASEQFSIGGPDSVRGYPQGEFSGDDGYSISAELRVSPLTNKELLQLAFFADHGGVSIKDPQLGQDKRHDLTGAGVGVRLKLPYDFNVRADVGFPIDPSRSSEDKDAVFYVQVVKRF